MFYINSNDVDGLIALVSEKLGQKSGQDPTIGAIRRLADLKDRRAIPVLRQAMSHSNVTVKTDAALALYKLGQSEGLDTLISWLSSDERLASRAAGALRDITDPRATAALQNSGFSSSSPPAQTGSYNSRPPSSTGGGCLGIVVVVTILILLTFVGISHNSLRSRALEFLVGQVG